MTSSSHVRRSHLLSRTSFLAGKRLVKSSYFYTRYRFAGQKSALEGMPSRFCRICNSKLAKERLCKVHHINVRKQQDFATYTRNINVKTAEVGFCDVRPNTIQCINSRERFLQGHMQCKFSKRRIQHVM